MKINRKLEKYLQNPKLQQLYDYTHQRFEASDLIAHKWDHIYRDIINAIWIGESEGAQMSIVLPAMILHDIGFLHNPDFRRHHRIGAERCPEWLTGWDAPQVALIAGCILCHKGSTQGFDDQPQTLEQQVVCDADALEKTGHIGIFQGVRAMIEFGVNGLEQGRSIQQMAEYFCAATPVKLFTATGKRMAAERGGDFRGAFSQRVLDELRAYL